MCVACSLDGAQLDKGPEPWSGASFAKPFSLCMISAAIYLRGEEEKRVFETITSQNNSVK